MNDNIYKTLAKVIFVLLILLSLFGAPLPFTERVENIDEVTSSNLINQVSYTLFFLVSIVIIINNRRDFFYFIKTEKFLTLFIIWCLISITWSNYPFVSFKRLFQLITVILVSISFLFYSNSFKDVLNTMKYVLYVYLVLTLFSVLFISQALDPQFGTWRGLTSHKNTLGQICVIISLLCYFLVRQSTGVKRIVPITMFIISLVLLLGTRSSTALISIMFLFSLIIGTKIDFIFKSIKIGRLISLVFVLTLSIMFISTIIFDPEFISMIPQFVGKDTSFSSRTVLWSYMWSVIDTHPLVGAGFQSFWVVDNPHVSTLYEIFYWLPNQGHNGYIDMLNELGIIGFMIFIGMLINVLIKMFKVHVDNFLVWIIVAVLIINLQETTLFISSNFTFVVFIISYLNIFMVETKRLRMNSDIDQNSNIYPLPNRFSSDMGKFKKGVKV